MKFAVFDIDGTVHRDAMSFIVAEPVIAQFGTVPEQNELKNSVDIWKARGSTESYWAYNKTILRLFENVLPRVPIEQFRKIVDEVIKDRGSHVYAYTTQLAKELKSDGYMLIAISGSIKDIVEPFALIQGFDIVVASGLEVIEGKLTGRRVAQTNKSKHELLELLMAEHGLSITDSVAIGDTHRDISILKMVKRPIAFNPNAALYEVAEQNSWKIVIERKNMVYELDAQGGKYFVKSAHPIYGGTHSEMIQ